MAPVEHIQKLVETLQFSWQVDTTALKTKRPAERYLCRGARVDSGVAHVLILLPHHRLLLGVHLGHAVAEIHVALSSALHCERSINIQDCDKVSDNFHQPTRKRLSVDNASFQIHRCRQVNNTKHVTKL